MKFVLACCALGLAGLALLLALGGFDVRTSRYLFGVAVVVFGLPALLCAFAELVIVSTREPRPGSFWDRQTRSLVADTMLIQRLSARPFHDLREVHTLNASQQRAFQRGQRFVLGATAAISPFGVLLLLTLPIGVASDMFAHYLPWAASFVSQPSVRFGLLIIGWCFVAVRLHAKFVNEHFDACATLLQCAMDRKGEPPADDVLLHEWARPRHTPSD